MFRPNEIAGRIRSLLAAACARLLGETKESASPASAPAIPVSSVSKTYPTPTNSWDDAEEWE
jgi:hypothetical protein